MGSGEIHDVKSLLLCQHTCGPFITQKRVKKGKSEEKEFLVSSRQITQGVNCLGVVYFPFSASHKMEH